MLFFFVDLIFITDPEQVGTYPSMYNNFLTSWIMSADWALDWIWPGVFKWYDMFTVQGWMNWFWDFLSLNFFFWPVQFIGRLITEDWYWLAPEVGNDVDMNRLFVIEDDFDPYNYSHYAEKNGYDCNGNFGYGNYCYCSSQGFECKCDYNPDFEGQVIKTCYDYFGYNCDGDYVDGVQKWCSEPGNTFTFLNN